jgi:prepilin peptidase CpaA
MYIRMMAFVALAVLASQLIVASVWDIRERRVPNWLTLSVFVTGVLLGPSWPPSPGAVGQALYGVALGFCIWIPLYLFRLVGAGDVKLIAASGAWLGVGGVVSASLWTAIAGGVLGAFWILRRRGAQAAMLSIVHALRAPRLLQLKPMDRRERVPYAVAISIGVLISWVGNSGTFWVV